MKTIFHNVQTCDCHTKLREHMEAQKAPMRVGSIVECDCNRWYRLTNDQREGLYWSLMTPDELGYILVKVGQT